jgi:hypothetical protein
MAAFAVFFYALPAQAALRCPGGSPSGDEMRAGIAQNVPDAAYTDLTGKPEGKALLLSFNSTPPLSITVPMTAVVGYYTAASRPDQVYIVILDDDCQAVGITIFREIMQKIIDRFLPQVSEKDNGLIQAQANCATRKEIARGLAQKHREVPVSMGLGSDGKMVEIFVSPDGSTWSIVTTSPQGVSCLRAWG